MAYPGLASINSLSSVRLTDEMQKRMLEAQVRTAKGKLKNQIKNSAGSYKFDDCIPHINSVVNIDCELELKYDVLPIKQLFSQCSQKDELKRVSEALNILEKYGRNLLRPSNERPSVWRSIMFANGTFSEKVHWMVGGKDILRQYGYCLEIPDGVSFPNDKEPDPNKAATVTSDIMLARQEIQLYIEGRHPHPSRFEQILPPTARVLQNLPHNAFESICDTYVPESIKSPVVEPLKAGSKLPPVVQQGPQTNRHDPFKDTVVEVPPPATTVLKPLIQDTPSTDGRKECDICGQQRSLFVCQLCDKKVLCKDCDEQWHKHPRRVQHQRQLTDINVNDARNSVNQNQEVQEPKPSTAPSTSQFRPTQVTEQCSGKSEVIRVIPGKGKNRLPNLPIFDTNPLTNNTEELSSHKSKVDLEKEMAFRGIRMQSGLADPYSAMNSDKLHNEGPQLPILSVFERTLTNRSTTLSSVDLQKEIESQGIKMGNVANPGNQFEQNRIKPMVGMPTNLPGWQGRVNVEDILKIPNFELKRVKLEALVISTMSDLKQTEENLQLVIVHEPNFLDNEVYQELIKKKERLFTDLQIYEIFRKRFEDEEKIKRLIQQNQDQVVFQKSLCLPPGESFIAPTTKSSIWPGFGDDRISTIAPSSLPCTVDPSFYEFPQHVPTTRPQQVLENSPWNIATNVLGVNAEYKGACPKCGNVTNYYNDVCHHCKGVIPHHIKEEVLPRSPLTPGKRTFSMDKIQPKVKHEVVPNIPVAIVPAMGAKPKVQSAKPTDTPKKQEREIQKTKPQTPQSSKFGVHPKRWICQHCTFENEEMTRVCLICQRTSDKPQYVEENITDDDKLSGEWGCAISPRNVAVNFQQDAEQMALEKKRAREEFKKMMEEEEEGRKKPDNTVVTDRGAFPKEDRNINLQLKSVSDEEKFEMQKKLDDIKAKKIEEKTLEESKETVKVLKLAETQGFTFDELEVALSKTEDNEKAQMWLQNTWQQLIQDFKNLAQESIEDPCVIQVSDTEARRALITNNCDLKNALSYCIQQRKEKIKELCEFSECTQKTAGESLYNSNGDIDEAFDFLSTRHLNEISKQMWTTYAMVTPAAANSTQTTSLSQPSSAHLRSQQYGRLDPTTEAIVMDRDIPFERRARIVLVEGKMRGWGRAENVLKILDLLPSEQEVTVNDVIDAVSNCGNIQDSLRYLLQECEMCFDTVPANKMLSLPLCQCKICMDCLKTYFEVQVKEKHVRDIVCPYCGQPDIHDEAQAETHFSFISMLFQSLVAPDLYNLFLEKLRDWKLMQDPNFRWCSHCTCGFIFNSEDGLLKMTCPDCNNYTCYECKKPWEPQHEGLSCQEFTLWKQMNDPEHQAAGLAKHLAENGIDCPECKYRYALAKGGCMHFKCTQCRHEFCSGCYKPFKRGENCQVLRSCASQGLHCHHPRDCLFYLRDLDVENLQKLLRENNIDFDTDADAGGGDGEQSWCPVLEQKEVANGYKDEACGREVPENSAGLCTIHYSEYLVSLINKNNIDPLVVMTTEELNVQCLRHGKEAPNKRRRESPEQYRNRLIHFIQQEVPLPIRNNGGGLT